MHFIPFLFCFPINSVTPNKSRSHLSNVTWYLKDVDLLRRFQNLDQTYNSQWCFQCALDIITWQILLSHVFSHLTQYKKLLCITPWGSRASTHVKGDVFCHLSNVKFLHWQRWGGCGPGWKIFQPLQWGSTGQFLPCNIFSPAHSFISSLVRCITM